MSRLHKQIVTTNLVVLVDVGERPLVVGHADALVLRLQIEEGPSGRLGDVLHVAGVSEAVQMLYVVGLGQLLQGDVDVVAVALLRDHEGDREECLASDQERRAGRGQGELLNVRDVHVQYLHIFM